MFGVEMGQGRDVVRVRGEVALRIPEVRAIEPDIGLVEDAVQNREEPFAVGRLRCLESSAVEKRAIVVFEPGLRLPMSGDGNVRPCRIVSLQTDARAQNIIGCVSRLPRTGEIEARPPTRAGGKL